MDIAAEAAGNEGGAKEYRDLAIANELEMIIPEIYEIQNKIKEAKDTGQEVNKKDIVRLEVLQTKKNNFTKSNPAAEADLFKTLLQGNMDIAAEAAGNEGCLLYTSDAADE